MKLFMKLFDVQCMKVVVVLVSYHYYKKILARHAAAFILQARVLQQRPERSMTAISVCLCEYTILIRKHFVTVGSKNSLFNRKELPEELVSVMSSHLYVVSPDFL